MPELRLDPDGLDIGWFALDQDGHVGFFVSGGSRVVPEPVLASRKTWELLDQVIKALPRVGYGKLSLFVGRDRKDWTEMAARGLYAYDFKPYDNGSFKKGEYTRIAIPSKPLTVASLDGDIGKALQRVTMGTICFARKRVVKQDLLLVS